MVSASKDLKEAHVAGHSGTSLQEVSAIAALPVASLLVLRWMSPSLPSSRGLAVQQSLEWLAFVPPQLACQLDAITASSLILASLVAMCAVWALQLACASPLRQPQPLTGKLAGQLRDAITLYRMSLLIITCIAILAVDFHAFPRRFAKAETFGTGLMDAGVGVFVLASAIPAGFASARRAAARAQAGKEATRIAALGALGFGRAIATHSLDYQNHVGEYGVHWNFFLTLAALRIANLGIAAAIKTTAVAAAALGVAVLVLHQCLLSGMGLIEYLHSAGARANLVAANKEGLLSLPGYLALHWLGVALGAWLQKLVAAPPLPPQPQQQQGQQAEGTAGIVSACAAASSTPMRVLASMAAADAALWLACWVCSRYVQPVSRRACNMTYVLWVLALTLQGIGLFLLAGMWRPGPVPLLLQHLNGAMLPTFLLANLLTGLVNLGTDTLAASWGATCALMLAYMAAVCGGGSAWAGLGRRPPPSTRLA